MNKEQLLQRQRELKGEIDKVNARQMCQKIFLNSLFG